MVTEEYKKALIDIINGYLPEAKISLVASRSKDLSDSGSDIDLVLDTGKKINKDILLNIEDEISASTIPYYIDLIDLHAIDEKFYQAIKKDLVVWKR